MEFINGLPEVSSPLLIPIPLALMVLSGYTIGKTISMVSRRDDSILTDLLRGNIILNFIFISGFIVFGFLISYAKGYFTAFTLLVIVLAAIGLYLMARTRITLPTKISFKFKPKENMHLLFGVGLFLSIIVYQGVVTYFHPIYLEYDSIYYFLLISKSILVGDGLNQDFFIGSDVALKVPPLNQVNNAWLIYSFGYSAMRLFPIYFVFLAALFVYRFAINVTNDSFLALIASSAFLVTPALLIISSHYSLQQDIPFIFLLCATFCFVSEIMRSEKPSSVHVFILILSLSLLSLTREVGVIISVAIFFLIPAMKFTKNNVVIRAFLTVLSLFPLYFLTFYDVFNNGITNSMGVRLISLIVANIAIFFISYQLRNQKSFKEFLSPNLKYLILLIFPSIFFVSNFFTIGGPFATIIFSSQFGESSVLHRQLFDITKDLTLSEALRLHLPRADVFLVALSMGSTFVFLRLRGFIRLVEKFNDNIQYPLMLILSIVLLVVWSYLLESGFEGAQVRHIAYFLPITSTLVAVAMNRKGTGDRLFYYGIIVVSTYYYLNYDLQIWNYLGHFGGFYIEPIRSALMNMIDFIPGTVIVFALLFYESREKKITNWFRSKPYLGKYSSFVFLALLAIQIYAISSSGLILSPFPVLDQVPPPQWEKNVFEIVDYLNTQEKGKVLSLRAPAISFFTNRTNFDLYNPHTFSRIYHLLLVDNSPMEFKEKILDMDIKYIILPNEKSSLYTLTQNLRNFSDVPQIVENDRDFERIDFSDFSIYEFNPEHTSSIDLLAQKYTWNSFGPSTQVSKINGNLNVVVLSTSSEKIYNRAYIQTQLNSTSVRPPLILSLEYSTQSGSAMPADFAIDIRDMNRNRLWGQTLSSTNSILTRQTFVLPDNIADKTIEVRLYVITENIGRHRMNVTNAQLSYR